MGLPMQNLHAPTVPSGPNSNAAQGETGKRSLSQLMSRKDDIEAELSALGEVLKSHGVDMNTSLTTPDGFPRSDIDVAQIRTTRAQAIRLRNDHKAIMNEIEKALHEHFAANSPPPASTTSSATASTSRGAATTSLAMRPFAKVNSVVPGSPAETAGLKAGDAIQKFGDADYHNNDKLSKVAQVVSENEGRSILVRVTRQEPGLAAPADIQLSLTPTRNWGGRGLLGCHLLPL